MQRRDSGSEQRNAVEVTVVLTPGWPRRASKLTALVQRLHASLEPLHPGVSDPSLARFYLLSLPADQFALERLQELRHLDGVEAAYIKPSDSPAHP